MKRLFLAAALTSVATLVLSASASAVSLVKVSSDPFTNTTSQHRTQVEPDTFAYGSTVVATFQSGRFFSGGASDIGWATSRDGGASWSNGFLPGITTYTRHAGIYPRVSDPSVAFAAKFGVWLISSIPLTASAVVPTVLVSRSRNGGTRWDDPVSIPPPAGVPVNLDKNWTVCDNNAGSPFYGNCYTEFDNFGERDVEYMSTSTDGGLTWGVPKPTADHQVGIGGQPVVQPNGTVVVPFESFSPSRMLSFISTDGGASWSATVTIAKIQFHRVAGNLRTSPLPSAEIDSAGRVYVAWEDCAFQPGCQGNDIVISTSDNGVTWSAKARVPIDALGLGDHFIPGLAVDRATSGASAHLALSFYQYPNADCKSSCQLFSGYTSSVDGGQDWTSKTLTSGPVALSSLAQTSQGPMVGDYESTSFNSAGAAVPVFAVANPPSNGVFDEAMYAVAGGFVPGATGAAAAASGAGANSTSTSSNTVPTAR